MTGSQTDLLLKRALTDGAFLSRLLTDPHKAGTEIGVTLSDEEAKAIAAMSADEVLKFAGDYRSATDPSMRRAAC